MGGGAAVACAKVGQIKIRLKTHDVAGGLGEGSFNRGGVRGNFFLLWGCQGRFLGFN